jgi:hypothetical protein
MNPFVFTWSLIIIGAGLIIFGLYALIKKAVKDALREYEIKENNHSINE